MSFLHIFKQLLLPKSARRLDGAAGGRRSFGKGGFHRINLEVAADAPLRSRARYLTANSPWLSQAVANWTATLVGSGTGCPILSFREVRDSNSEAITCKSDKEMAPALAALDCEIAAASKRPANTIQFKTSKGV